MSVTKDIKEKIWLSPPHMVGGELQFIEEAFRTNWIAPLGPNVNEFENDIALFLGENKYITAVSTGTAAIHLGLRMLGVSKNDIVLCQSMTFVATVNPVIQLGATPIFIDSEEKTWNLCPKLLKKAIEDQLKVGKKPKAILAVHLYGMPYLVKEIHAIAKEYGIPILEDSAEAFGSTYENRQCGTFGDVAILSFNGNKIITTSGGGALITKTESEKQEAIFLATQAKDKAIHYQHSVSGYNYRMSNVLAGIGRGQMQQLPNFVEKRQSIFRIYKKLLKDTPIVFLEDIPNGKSNRWLTTILTNDFKTREHIRLALLSENIECRPLWKPMHLQPVFSDKKAYVNGISDQLFEVGLCLPSGSAMIYNDVKRVVSVIKSIVL